jgi:CHAT domain
MKSALVFIPNFPTHDALLGLVCDTLKPSCTVTVIRSPQPHNLWKEVLDGKSLAVSFIPGGDDFCYSQDLLPIRNSSVNLLSECSRLGVVFIGIGPTLDSALYERLRSHKAYAYVSMSQVRTFQESLQQVVDLAVTQTTTGGSSTQFLNILPEFRLIVSRDLVLWSSTQGFQDSHTVFHFSDTPTWPGAIIRQWKDLNTHALTDMEKSVDDLGHLLGSLLLPDTEANKFYRTVVEVSMAPHRIPVYANVTVEWVELPIEIALLPPTGRMLCMAHSTYRIVKGLQQRRTWSMPRNRGLKVLLFASDASGTIVDCAHQDKCCCSHELPKIRWASIETDRIASIFNSQKTLIIEKIEHVRGAAATVDTLYSLLSEPWDIIHFAGHGVSWSSQERRCSCLLLREASSMQSLFKNVAKAVKTDFWLNIFTRKSPEAFVYFSSCEGLTGGLCQDVARQKSCEVIGYQAKIDDEAACEMAVSFYSELIRLFEMGEADVGQALLNARINLLARDHRHRAVARQCTICLSELKKD